MLNVCTGCLFSSFLYIVYQFSSVNKEYVLTQMIHISNETITKSLIDFLCSSSSLMLWGTFTYVLNPLFISHSISSIRLFLIMCATISANESGRWPIIVPFPCTLNEFPGSNSHNNFPLIQTPDLYTWSPFTTDVSVTRRHPDLFFSQQVTFHKFI